MRFVLALLIILCPPVLAADITGRFAGGVEVTLTDAPCTSALVLARIRADWHDRFKAGIVKLKDRALQLCWILSPDMKVILVDDEGGVTPIGVESFATIPNEPGI